MFVYIDTYTYVLYTNSNCIHRYWRVCVYEYTSTVLAYINTYVVVYIDTKPFCSWQFSNLVYGTRAVLSKVLTDIDMFMCFGWSICKCVCLYAYMHAHACIYTSMHHCIPGAFKLACLQSISRTYVLGIPCMNTTFLWCVCVCACFCAYQGL